MPKAPIIERDLLYEKLPDGSIRLLDQCLVLTELGTMMEPRQVNIMNGTEALRNVDVYDANYTRIREVKGDVLINETGSAFRQILSDFSPQGV